MARSHLKELKTTPSGLKTLTYARMYFEVLKLGTYRFLGVLIMILTSKIIFYARGSFERVEADYRLIRGDVYKRQVEPGMVHPSRPTVSC